MTVSPAERFPGCRCGPAGLPAPLSLIPVIMPVRSVSAKRGAGSRSARIPAPGAARAGRGTCGPPGRRRRPGPSPGRTGTGSNGEQVSAGDYLSRRAPGLLRVLRETDPEHVLLDGTLAECDRVGDSRSDFSQKHRRHGVNVQVIADPTGKLLWISPALPGRTHDLTAARTHGIIRICERQGVPVLADRPTSEPAPG